MTYATKHRLLVRVLCLLLLSACPAYQENSWEKYNEAAKRAYEQADYVEAEKLFLAALSEAEKFGEKDSRFATSLNNPGELYRAQGIRTQQVQRDRSPG